MSIGAEPAGTIGKGRYVELLRSGRALYTALIVGGVTLHATQILVIAIVMPTVLAMARLMLLTGTR